MVVTDESSLSDALQLVDVGPVRYFDTNLFVVISSPDTLEYRIRTAFARGDIAVVVPVGMESTLEDHGVELRKERIRRVEQEKRDIKAYFREHPEQVEEIKAEQAAIEAKRKKRGSSGC